MKIRPLVQRATRWGWKLLLPALVLAGVAALVSDDAIPVFNKHDKAFYRDAQVINFVRPGLVVEITSASIAADGTISANFTLQDPRGLPLDREGIFTPGTVSTSFVVATIPQGQTQYTAYTTRTVSSNLTGNSAVQAAADSGGTYTKVADGEYTYTFGTKAPMPFDANATHTIGVYSSRNLSEFDLGTDYDDDTFDFLPSGAGEPTNLRSIVDTQDCNSCHNPLSAHGGSRRSVELCIMCHTPQSSDPDTGNTIDFKVMVHKIHQGVDLPSVQAGTPYQIIGFRDSVHDYSTVEFPADTRNCAACHGSDPDQTPTFLNASRVACGSCHDNVNFATGENHVDLPQVSDANCTQCHVPQGELEFDASILGAHTIPRFSRDLPGTVFELMSVDNAAPGQQPTVNFKISDKSGNPLMASDLSRLSLVLAGPTTDYLSVESQNALSATAKGNGVHSFTFPDPLPADASGTYTVGIEGYRSVTLLPGTRKEQTVRDAGENKVLSFSVDGSQVQERRTIVDVAKCNSCHASLSLHGDNRNQTQQCVLCHNPRGTDAARRPEDQGPAQSINFALMIHKIHRGEELTNEYTVFGFGGTPHDFTEERFPGDLRDCATCHVNGSEENLEAATAMITDPRGLINPVSPITSACTGCHTHVHAASHALTNTSQLGEACEACHGADAEFAVSKVHAR